MKVEILTLQTLFQNPVRYEIPVFQRTYIWTQDDQWEPLWEDVRNTAERFLDSQRDAKSDSAMGQVEKHFLGAVVLQQQQTMISAGIDKRIVVDGQQRLITLQLLIDSVREQLEKQGGLGAQRLSLLVLNNEAFYGGDPDYAFKLWPTAGDQNAFRQAMRNELPSQESKTSKIIEAHEFFKAQAQQWLDDQPEELESRAAALENAVAHGLEMVVIGLEPADNPHIIYETLNARGTALLQSDLVKNFILREVSTDGGFTDLPENDQYWPFGDSWWREETGRGRNTRARIEAFINYWLNMRTYSQVAPSNVFAEFRDYSNGKTIGEVATDISRVSRIYRSLEELVYPELDTFLYRRGVMDVGALTPVLLWILASEVPTQQRKKGLSALESYLVRRMLCRMSTRSYFGLFVDMVRVLEEGGPEQAGDTIVGHLMSQTTDEVTWPDDRRLEATFVNLDLYKLLTRGRLRMVLEGIEGGLRTSKAESLTVPRGLTIEHIMPQDWHENWPLPVDVADERTAAVERDHIIHTIGNLTLVNRRLNPSLSNAPWEDKRKNLDQHTVLFLNKNLLDGAPDVWNEAGIVERARRLCEVAAMVWPYADKIEE